MLQSVNTIDEAINFLFPELVLQDPFACLKRAFLSPKNIHVDDFNSKHLTDFHGMNVSI
jgi:hypothetical protein